MADFTFRRNGKTQLLIETKCVQIHEYKWIEMKCARHITRHVLQSVSVKIAQWFLGVTIDSKLNHYTHCQRHTKSDCCTQYLFNAQERWDQCVGFRRSMGLYEQWSDPYSATVWVRALDNKHNLNKTLKSPGSSSQNNGGSISMYTFQLTESPDRYPTHWLLSQNRSSQGQGAARLHGTVEQFFNILA